MDSVDEFAALRTWAPYAACRDRADISWFPEVGESTGPAKAACATCPVRRACLDYAIAHDIDEGVWGGLSRPERRAARRLGLTVDEMLTRPVRIARRVVA
jgi:WhiB family transcriptional regulator, redox-sensing transcriptional regulator